MIDAWQRAAARGPLRAVLLAAALLFFVGNAATVARLDTPTPDEFVYVPAGLYHLQTGDLSFDPTNPPLQKMLMAAPLAAMGFQLDLDPRRRDNRTGWGPWIFGTSFLEKNRERYLDGFFAARLVVVGFGAALGALVVGVATTLVSPLAVLAVAVLFASQPVLLAHSGLATLDVAVSTWMFAMLVAARRFAATRSAAWAAASGALFGLGFATKGTALLFAPLLPVVAFVGWGHWRGDSRIRFLVGGAAMAAGAWAAVLAAYGFQGFPLPAPLVEGVRFQLAAGSAGEFPAFLAGQWSQKGWWWYHLAALAWKTPLATLVFLGAGFVALAAPLLRGRSGSDPSDASAGASAGAPVTDAQMPGHASATPQGAKSGRSRRGSPDRKARRTEDARAQGGDIRRLTAGRSVAGAGLAARLALHADALWLLLPPLLLLYLLSFHYAKDYGVRYMLPAFPFLVLLAGRGVDYLLAHGRAGLGVVATLLAWQVGAAAWNAPHHLATFNELAGGTDHARRLLLDSNLDWGQDLGRFADFARERGIEKPCLAYFGHVDPRLAYGLDYTMPPSRPAPGLCAVSANFLAGYPYAITYAGERILGVKAGAWSWFDRLEPVARVGRSIYVFDVTSDDAARLSTPAAP